MSILFFAGGIALLCLFCWIFARPLKLLIKLVLSSILGAVVLVIINLVGGNFGVTIAINPITAAITGVLGLPGVILLFIAKLIFPGIL